MVQINSFFAAVFGLAAMVSAASAATSDWYETDGGRIRIVASEPQSGNATFKGVLQVELRQGWKTYWLDPGSSGVPPQINVAATPEVSGVDIGFPPPHRFEDPYGSWIGYKTSTNFALTFSVNPHKLPAELDAGVFLGICQDICIPVQANLSIPLNPAMTDPAADSLVQAVFATMPKAAGPDFGVTEAKRGDDGHLQVSAKLPGTDKKPELFLQNSDDWYFGDPEIVSSEDGVAHFSLPVLESPATFKGSVSLPYTLVSAGRSVNGMLSFEPPSQ